MIRTREDLARALTALRVRSGWTVRDLARRLDTPVATLGDYFSGRHLPGTRQMDLYRRLLAECGVPDGPAVDAWVAALTRARRVSDGRAAKGAPPYRGLDPFRETDAGMFFGRESVVDELLGRLRDLGSAPGGMVVLVGASGSGKSSVLMAGLVPAVNGGALDGGGAGWGARVVTPDGLALESPGGEGAEAGRRTLVVVDQFEEALTLPDDSRSRLLEHLRVLQERTLVVVGIRADFYQEATAEAALLPALRHNQVLLGPMTADEVRQAVLGPARQVGAAVEDGLVELVLADLAPAAPAGVAHDPGALPLLSYALLATWQASGQSRLTVAGYLAVGGLRGAVRQAAEDLYMDLTPAGQDAARALFARLVRLDRDGPLTRRRALRQDLFGPGDTDPAAGLRAVTERFVAARLLTVEADTVQISHEALLAAWPRLGDWVEADREWLRLRHQLSDAAEVWLGADRDESLLWAGARLGSFLEQATPDRGGPGPTPDRGGSGPVDPGRLLSRVEQEFLDASLARRDREARSERRRIRRTQQLLGAVAFLAVVAVVLAAVAVSARDGADRARDQALSRQVAVEARDLQAAQPALAAQLAVAAYRISPTVQARSAVVDATAGSLPTRLLGPAGPTFSAVSGDGRVLAVARSGTDTVAVYRRTTGPPHRVAVIPAGGPDDQDFAVAVSPDGRLLAVSGTGRVVGLWDITDPARPVRTAAMVGFTSTVYALDFAPDGRHLAGAGADGTVRRWDVSDPRHPVAGAVLAAPGGAPMKAVAYSPDGLRLAAAGGAGTLVVWTGGGSPQVADAGSGVTLQSVGFSPDGRQVMAGGTDAQVRIWDAPGDGPLTPARAPIHAATAELNCGAFSPDGSLLAAGSSDGTISLYDTRTWAVVDSLQMPQPVTSVLFTPGGRSLVSSDSGGRTRIWSLPDPSSYTEPGQVFDLGYAYGGRILVAGSSGPDGRAATWDTADPSRPLRLGTVADPAGFGPVAGAAAVSARDRLLAAADGRADVQLFSLAADGSARAVGPVLRGADPHVEEMAFAPDGRTLVTGDDGGQLLLWDVRHPAGPELLSKVDTGTGEVLGVSIGPRSRILAAAGSDDRVRLYDISRPNGPVPLSTVGGFRSYVFDTTITPDGRTLIACSADGTIRLWNISDPLHPRLLGHPLSGPNGDIYHVAVSPDGRTLAGATTDHSVWLWDISDPRSPRLLDSLEAARDSVFTVTFSPDGRYVVAAGSDRTLHFWTFDPAAATRRICSVTGAAITRAEWATYVQGMPYRPACSS